MSKLAPYLKNLEEELLALNKDAMLLEQLDGFIAGLLVCPEFIDPRDWLPVVWGNETEPAFESLSHMNRVLSLVMEHYNTVSQTLLERPGQYAPLFPVDERNGDIIWEVWIEGFEQAVEMRPAAWEQLWTCFGKVESSLL
jgi:uncharacterized protein